jgi:ADP-ribose pyrophosphatase YjhB (NUDIX family)
MSNDRIYPARPIVGVGALVWRNDKILLIKRGKPPAQGEWSLPGGAQELGETVEETARREVREETGCEIGALRFLGVFDSIERDDRGEVLYHFTLVDFETDWVSGEPSPGEAEDDARFFAVEELDGLKVWDALADVIRMSAQSRIKQRS